MLVIIKRITICVCLIVGFLASNCAAFEVSPLVKDIYINQGSEELVEITVLNTEGTQSSYFVSLVEVELGQGVDEVSFIELDGHALDWIDLNTDEFELVSGEERVVNLRIAPDESINSQVLVLGIQIFEKSNNSGSINIQTAFTSLIFITVGDDVVSSAELLSSEIQKNNVFSNQVDLYYTLRNQSQGIVQPTGNILLQGWTGRVVGSEILNYKMTRLAPDQIRTFEEKLVTNGWLVGPYQVLLDASFSDIGDNYVFENVVWFFSWKLMVLMGLVAVVIIIVIVFRRKYVSV